MIEDVELWKNTTVLRCLPSYFGKDTSVLYRDFRVRILVKICEYLGNHGIDFHGIANFSLVGLSYDAYRDMWRVPYIVL